MRAPASPAASSASAGSARLARRHGIGPLAAAMDEAIAYSERRLRARIQEVPDGDYTAVDWIEGDGWEERPIRLEATIRIRGVDVEVDWTGTDPQVRGGINLSLPTTSGVGVYAIRAALDPTVPANAGMFAPVRTSRPRAALSTLARPRPLRLACQRLPSGAPTC